MARKAKGKSGKAKGKAGKGRGAKEQPVSWRAVEAEDPLLEARLIACRAAWRTAPAPPPPLETLDVTTRAESSSSSVTINRAAAYAPRPLLNSAPTHRHAPATPALTPRTPAASDGPSQVSPRVRKMMLEASWPSADVAEQVHSLLSTNCVPGGDADDHSKLIARRAPPPPSSLVQTRGIEGTAADMRHIGLAAAAIERLRGGRQSWRLGLAARTPNGEARRKPPERPQSAAAAVAAAAAATAAAAAPGASRPSSSPHPPSSPLSQRSLRSQSSPRHSPSPRPPTAAQHSTPLPRPPAEAASSSGRANQSQTQLAIARLEHEVARLERFNALAEFRIQAREAARHGRALPMPPDLVASSDGAEGEAANAAEEARREVLPSGTARPVSPTPALSDASAIPPPTPRIVAMLDEVGTQFWPAHRDWRGGGPAPVQEAAKGFDQRHGERLSFADRVHAAVYQAPADILRRTAFDEALREVRRNRLFLREKLGGPTFKLGGGPRKRLWRLEKSIFAPRPDACDAHDFFNTAACCRQMFEVDWRHAVAAGLARYIEKNDDGDEAEDPLARVAMAVGTAATAEQHAGRGVDPPKTELAVGSRDDEMTAGLTAEENSATLDSLDAPSASTSAGAEPDTPSKVPEAISVAAQGPQQDASGGAADSGLSGMIVGEVEQVAQVMWHHYALVCALFDYYAATGASDDIFHIMFNSWAQFVSDFGLVDNSQVVRRPRRLQAALNARAAR